MLCSPLPGRVVTRLLEPPRTPPSGTAPGGCTAGGLRPGLRWAWARGQAVGPADCPDAAPRRPPPPPQTLTGSRRPSGGPRSVLGSRTRPWALPAAGLWGRVPQGRGGGPYTRPWGRGRRAGLGPEAGGQQTGVGAQLLMRGARAGRGGRLCPRGGVLPEAWGSGFGELLSSREAQAEMGRVDPLFVWVAGLWPQVWRPSWRERDRVWNARESSHRPGLTWHRDPPRGRVRPS